MTKIIAEFKQDNISKKGRKVAISWTTDDSIVNSYLRTPRMYHQHFETNATSSQIMNSFSDETVPLVQNAENEIKKGMTGRKFEVDV